MCVLFSKWSDGLDILVLGVPSLVSHWKRTMSLQQWRCWLYTRKCLHFCLLPALFLYAVLVFKWSDGLDILVLGVPSLVSHWKRTMSLQQWIVIVLVHT